MDICGVFMLARVRASVKANVCVGSYPCLFYVLIFQDRVSLCNSGCPGTQSVDQAGLELTDP